MPVPEEHADRQDGTGDFARKIAYLIRTTLRPVTDREHERDLAAADGQPIERRLRPMSLNEISAAVTAAGFSCTPEYIGRLRDGQRDNPTLKLMIAFAKVFNRPIGYLVNPHVSCEVNVEAALTRAERLNSLFTPVGPDAPEDGEIIYFSEAEVAKAIGADVAEIRALRDGSAKDDDVPVSLLQRLADFFGVPVAYLLGDAEDAQRVSQGINMLQDLNGRGVLVGALRKAHQVKDPQSRENLAGALAHVVDAFLSMEATKKGATSASAEDSAPPA